VQQAGCEGGGGGGPPFSDGMKTPSGKRQARLKGMAASGRRGGVTELWRRPMWGEDGGLAARHEAWRRLTVQDEGGSFFCQMDGARLQKEGVRGRAAALCETRHALSHSFVSRYIMSFNI